MTKLTTLTSTLFILALLSSAVLKADSLSINLDVFALNIGENTEVGQVVVNHLIVNNEEYLEVVIEVKSVDWIGGTTFIYAGTAAGIPLALKGNQGNGHIPQGSDASTKEMVKAFELGDYSNTAVYRIPMNDIVTAGLGNFALEIHTEVFELSYEDGDYFMTDAKTAKAAGASSIAAKMAIGTK